MAESMAIAHNKVGTFEVKKERRQSNEFDMTIPLIDRESQL
jgi:hypothetical protein